MSALSSIGQICKLRKLETGMRNAQTYSDWNELARMHDDLSGAEEWKEREDSELFDARQIRKRYKVLQNSVDCGDSEETLFALNEGVHGNMGGMGKAALYRKSKLGTKKLVNSYVEMVMKALKQVANAPDSEIQFDEKLDFFRRASHCYGRSALSMNGGSGLLYFHHGVVDTLLEHGLLPRVISGSSVGAWMAAQIGTRTNDELNGYFQGKRYDITPGANLKNVVDLVRGVGRIDSEIIRDEIVDDLVGDVTFQEAFEHTGRYINISIAPVERDQASRLMNAITSPNVTIRSAVRASTSVPGMIEPAELEAKDSSGRIKPYLRSRRWVDGSFSEDLPFKRLSRLFGVNYYIVSLINPVVTPFLQGDPKTIPDGLGKSARNLIMTGFKESLRNSRRWVSPISLGKFDSLLGSVYQSCNQDYLGDINIVLDQSEFKSRYALFNYKDDGEIQQLMTAGRRASWPKLDQIRNSVQVSQVIDEILEQLESDAVTKPHSRHMAHMTM